MERLYILFTLIALLVPGYSHAVLMTYKFDITFDMGGGTGHCPDFICDNLPNTPASGMFTFDTDFVDQNERVNRGRFQGATEAYIIIDGVRIDFDQIEIITNLIYNDMLIYLDRDYEIVNFNTGYVTDMSLSFLIRDAMNNADVLPGMRKESASLSARTNIQGSFGSHNGYWRGNTNLVTGNQGLGFIPKASVSEPPTIQLMLSMLIVMWMFYCKQNFCQKYCKN